MDPGNTWLERTATGHPVFVRKKAKSSSTTDLIMHAFRPNGRRSPTLSRTGNDVRVVSAPAAQLEFPITTTGQEVAMMNPVAPPFLGHPPQQAFFPAQPQTFYPPQSFGLHQPQPIPNQVYAPPRPLTANDLKYKCKVCGKFRSQNYTKRHPLPPGQLPSATVCRRCERDKTSTEDSSDSSTQPRRSRRRRRRRGHHSDRMLIAIDADSDNEERVSRRHGSVEITRRRTSRDRYRRRHYRRESRSSSHDRVHVSIGNDGRRTPERVVERIRYIDESFRGRPSVREDDWEILDRLVKPNEYL